MSASCAGRPCPRVRMNRPARARLQRRLVSNRRLAWLALTAIGLASLVLFVADNFVLVEIRLLVTRVQVRLAWALLAAFGLGAASALAIDRLRRLWRD